MNAQSKFSLGKEPYIRKADSKFGNTQTIMRDFVIALIPLIIFAWVKNGLMPFIDGNCNFWGLIKPLVFILSGGITSFGVEFLYYRFIMKDKNTLRTVMNSFAIIPGLLLAMILPLNTPVWVLIICCLVAVVVGKLLFGGFGCNIFNPALVGYLFYSVTYFGVASSLGGFMNGTEAITIVSGATPLSNFANTPLASGTELALPYGGIWNFIIGTIPGSLAETSGLLCIISCVWLIVRKVINWRIPVFYVGGVFVLTYLVGAINGNPGDFVYPLFQVFSGGLLFGAVFMATEPVTSPKTPNGKIFFALALAAITVFLRYNGNMPEGVATSIMFMNLFVVIIDRICAKIRSGGNIKKSALVYSSFAIILLSLSTYTVAATTNIIRSEVEFVRVGQDYDNLTEDKLIAYYFTVDGNEVIVYTNIDQEITEISGGDYSDEYFTERFAAAISENKLNTLIYSYSENGDNHIVNVLVKGYSKSQFTIIFEFNANYVMVGVTKGDDYSESYDNEHNNGEYNGPGWVEANGRPEEVLPDRIIDNLDNLDNVTTVSGATVTSNAFINGAKEALKFIHEHIAVSKGNS